MKKQISFYLDRIELSIYSSFQQRSSFFTESLLIFFSNLSFVFLWWLFFQRFPLIAGWSFADMLLMMSIVFGAFGLQEIFFGGIQDLPSLIKNKELDAYLALPTSPLLLIASSRSFPSGWGHLLSSIGILYFGKVLAFQLIPFFLLCIAISALLFTAVSLTINSLSFWISSGNSIAKRYTELFLLFALYPAHLYEGVFKVLLFSILPAGTIGTLPVKILREGSFYDALFFLSSATFFLFFGVYIFKKGIRAYKGALSWL